LTLIWLVAGVFLVVTRAVAVGLDGRFSTRVAVLDLSPPPPPSQLTMKKMSMTHRKDHVELWKFIRAFLSCSARLAKPNAGPELRLKAGARDERAL
jgi:hypothetical protein